MQVTTYKQAIDFLFSTKKPMFGDHTPGEHLFRIKRFLEFVGNPQNSYPTIHIGGTAGKGSTCYLTAKILAELGLKVGLHLSPNLVSLNEKFKIYEANDISCNDGRKIFRNCTDQEFIDLMNWFIKENEKFNNQYKLELTYYEIVIALVFKFYEIKKVDVAVIEVALGGKFDATNVLDSQIAILNSVGLDHQEILGDTVELITQDKMQIMKPGKHFLSGLRDNKLNSLISKHAETLGSKLEIIGKNFNYKILKSDVNGSEFMVEGFDKISEKENLSLALIGEFQVHNACLAIRTIEIFTKIKNITIPAKFDGKFSSLINKAFQDAHFSARFNIIQKEPLIIFDGAHNDIKMGNFVESIRKYFDKKEIELLISFKHGKDVLAMLQHLNSLNIRKIYITEFHREYYTNIESNTVQEINDVISKVFKSSIEIVECVDPIQAYELFKSNLKNDRVGIVTGSLYLLGNLYEEIGKGKG